jgi:hypothetical protein
MTCLRRWLLLGAVLLVGFANVRAQQAVDAPAAGNVSGVITYGDTQRPARFASVMLTPVPSDKPAVKPMSPKELEVDPAAAMKMVREQMAGTTMLQGQTGLDGSYSISNVPPGDYYLSPSAPGYVSSLAAAQAAAPEGTTGKKVFAGVPVVHVEANRVVRGDVTLDRGAAVSGTIAFDDGAPAGTIIVMIKKFKVAKDEDASTAIAGGMAMMFAGGTGHMAVADDRGHFRVAGIAAGDYELEATLQVSAGFAMRSGVMDLKGITKSSPLTIYAPGTLHKKEATKITLRAGEERGDVNITVNLTGMHTVSGRLASAVDHHALNEGSVELTDAADKDFKRTAQVDATGAFTVSYVPSGTYTLAVSDGADTEPVKKKPGGGFMNFATTHTLKSYEDASQPLIVSTSDVAGVTIELKESKTVKKDIDMNELFKN